MKVSTVTTTLLLGALSAVELLAGGISATREVPYPSEFEVRTSPDGRYVYAIPTAFKTRKVGTSLQIKAVGVVQHTTRRTRQGQAIVQLMLKDGRKLSTTVGRYVKFKGETYRAAGWKGNHFVLLSPKTRKSLYFKKS